MFFDNSSKRLCYAIRLYHSPSGSTYLLLNRAYFIQFVEIFVVKKFTNFLQEKMLPLIISFLHLHYGENRSKLVHFKDKKYILLY
jgi:hypothetical protein